jgi:hypothetical protein
MARGSARSNFWTTIFALILYTLMCGAVPIYHQVTGRDLKPALNINLDSVYLFVFLLGTAIIMVAAGLNRRIAALENKSAATEAKDNANRLSSQKAEEKG